MSKAAGNGLIAYKPQGVMVELLQKQHYIDRPGCLNM